MRKNLLNYIVCPDCFGTFGLSVESESRDEVESGSLNCERCHKSYPIVRFIPRLLDSDNVTGEEAKVRQGFGFQWNTFKKVEPSDETYFYGCISPVTKSDLKDKIVLDAGCGMGRFTFNTAKAGAKYAIGLDFSSAVEAAYENCGNMKNVAIVQASIYKPPFRPETFDYIYSLGVLHHLPEPELGFKTLVPLLKSRGKITAWVYGKEGNGWVTKIVTPIRRMITSKMPEIFLKPIATILGLILFCMIRGIYLPLLSIHSKFEKVLPYAHYFLVLKDDTLKQVITVVFDHLHTPIAFYYSREEFNAWFQLPEIGQFELHNFHSYSWSGLGTKQ